MYVYHVGILLFAQSQYISLVFENEFGKCMRVRIHPRFTHNVRALKIDNATNSHNCYSRAFRFFDTGAGGPMEPMGEAAILGINFRSSCFSCFAPSFAAKYRTTASPLLSATVFTMQGNCIPPLSRHSSDVFEADLSVVVAHHQAGMISLGLMYGETHILTFLPCPFTTYESYGGTSHSSTGDTLG